MANIAFNPHAYGSSLIDIYDEFYPRLAMGDPMRRRLVALADGGAALEHGIGTGRVALPLAEDGVPVSGIEINPDVVAKLHAREGAARLAEVKVGSFADVDVTGTGFSLIYVVFNTFFGLVTQEEQCRCLMRSAARLRPGGRFVSEAFPPLARLANSTSLLMPDFIKENVVKLVIGAHDPVAQRLDCQNIYFGPQGVRTAPFSLRYVWPSEMDLMARLAGLELEARWSNWLGEPFTAGSTNCISVYRKPTA